MSSENHEPSIIEGRFYRYVDGYHKEVLPEAEALRTKVAEKLLEVRFDTEKKIDAKKQMRRVDDFIAWVKG